MGVLRVLALVVLASGCTEVVVDPFDVQVDPPPDLVDLFVSVEGAYEAENVVLHIYVPQLGQFGEQAVLSGRANFHFPLAIEAGTPNVLVAGFFDFDWDRCCRDENDASFGRDVELAPVSPTIVLGSVVFEPMASLPRESCPFFAVGDPSMCFRMEMPGP